MRSRKLALALGAAALVLPIGATVATTTAASGVADASTASSTAGHGGHRPEFKAQIKRVDRKTRAEMIGVSWKPGCPVPIRDLRIIRMNHWGFDGKVHRRGELMVHKDVARHVVRVFGKLFRDRFPIRRIELIEKYDGSDDASMAADNTSSFNCRAITGQPGTYSIHSYGKAIDINTIENPYVKGTTVLPPAGKEFTDRTDVRPGMIVAGDRAVTEFAKYGFDWGGGWTTLKDYQHFEIPQP